jgi:hypothetical protein
MLQAGRSLVRVPMRSLNFFKVPNPSIRTVTLGLSQPVTEMSTKKYLWGVARPARKADNLTICEPIV